MLRQRSNLRGLGPKRITRSHQGFVHQRQLQQHQLHHSAGSIHPAMVANSVPVRELIHDKMCDAHAVAYTNPLGLAQHTLSEMFDTINTHTPWNRPVSSRGKPLPRSACWFTDGQCGCKYKYAGTEWDPQPYPDWLSNLASQIDAVFPDVAFNVCNANLYSSGVDEVGWHHDDEKIFDTHDRSTTILSISFEYSYVRWHFCFFAFSVNSCYLSVN